MRNSELSRTREEFELSRNKYAELYELAPVGFFTFDTHGVVREANITGARLLGTQRRALIDTPFSCFLADAEGRKLFIKYLGTVLLGQGAQRCDGDRIVHVEEHHREKFRGEPHGLQCRRRGAVQDHGLKRAPLVR